MNNGISFGERTMNNFGVSLSILVAIFKFKSKIYEYFVGFYFVRIVNYFFHYLFCWIEK